MKQSEKIVATIVGIMITIITLIGLGFLISNI